LPRLQWISCSSQISFDAQSAGITNVRREATSSVARRAALYELYRDTA
jgi:hypothetical protein